MKTIIFHNVYEVYNKNNYMFENIDAFIGENLFEPFVELKQYAENLGINVATSDSVQASEASAFVFLDMPKTSNRFFNYALRTNRPMYLLTFESELINRANFIPANHRYFEKVFTWYDNLVDHNKFIKINFSHRFPSSVMKNFSDRNKLCTIVSSNKRLKHSLELYSKRVEAIKWFEEHYPDDFDLYGIGWDEFRFDGPKPIRALNRIKLLTKLLSPKYSSYKGKVSSKRNILSKYKFSICYENAKDIPGYITEKIFDCFFAGCIPIYWGACNITEHIPPDCFIDMREFNSYESLYRYIKHMDTTTYMAYLNSIENFLNDPKSDQFSSKYFCQTLLKGILG